MKRRMSTAVTLLAALAMVLAMSVSAFAGGFIGKDAALKKALDNAGLKKSQVKQIDIDLEKAKNKYEVEFTKKKNGAEYEYDINAQSGKILEKSVDYKYRKDSSRSKIGKEAAKKKVAEFSGISYKIIDTGTCKYKYDDGEGVYKVKFKNNGRAYKYEVLAPTGKIIEYEWKLVS